MVYDSRYQAPEARTSPYNTRSEALENGKAVDRKPRRYGKASAIVGREQLRQQRGGIERVTAWIVLFVSVLGTIAALAGGWTPLIHGIITLKPQWYAIVGGLGMQGVLTFLEWYYFDQPLIAWPARLLDAIMTALGYGPLFIASLIGLFVWWNVPQSYYAASIIIWLASLVIAWYPESRLVD